LREQGERGGMSGKDLVSYQIYGRKTIVVWLIVFQHRKSISFDENKMYIIVSAEVTIEGKAGDEAGEEEAEEKPKYPRIDPYYVTLCVLLGVTIVGALIYYGGE
jgi:hypothetical protein